MVAWEQDDWEAEAAAEIERPPRGWELVGVTLIGVLVATMLIFGAQWLYGVAH